MVTAKIRNTSGAGWKLKETWWTTGCQDHCSDDNPGCIHNTNLDIIDGEYKWHAAMSLCGREGWCTAWGSMVYWTIYHGALSYPEPPVSPEGWSWTYGCNPHDPTCIGLGCFAQYGWTYMWECL